MNKFKSALVKSAIIAAVAGSAIAATATTASAGVACNRFGECWHVQNHYTNYPTGLGIRFHNDNWGNAHRSNWHWRADRPNDHGYYRNGVWTGF